MKILMVKNKKEVHKRIRFNFSYFEGEQFTKLKYGYKKLIDFLCSQLPKSSIKLNELVEKIEYTSNGVKLTVLNKTNEIRQTYTADYVVTTMSLGYLKKFHHDLFEPKLPALKIKAIENLGFGCVNKIFVVFEKSDVLSKRVEGLQILWRDDIEFKLDVDAKWNFKVRS